MTPKDARLEHIEHYRELVAYYTEAIEYNRKKLENENLSEIRRKCYEGLLELDKRELATCRKELLRFLSFKE